MVPKSRKVREIYMDHAAATPVDKAVFEAMKPYFGKEYGNPSSLYKKGRAANGAVNEARRKVAGVLHALSENIIFTGSGTESDNLAVYGIARAHEERGRHIVSTRIEHHAVLEQLADLEKQGWQVTYVKVNGKGVAKAEDVAAAIRPDTVLVTIMYANNEMGAVEPIADIGREILKYRKENGAQYPYFHTDACQAAGYLTLDVEKLHVDLLTLNGSKIYGPKGVGVLYLRRGVKIRPMILGGGQEKKMRSGTENVAGIVGLAKALSLAEEKKEKEYKRVEELSKHLYKKIQEKIIKIRLNGPEFGPERLPNNLNVTFMDIEGEALLLYLDEYGIMCSTGSACASESLEPSHVLRAIGLPYEYAHGSLRFTLGRANSKADIDYMMKYLPAIVEKLREMSPVNLGREKHDRYK